MQNRNLTGERVACAKIIRSVIKLVLDILIIMLLCIFALSFLYFLHGSFEDFPTEEQQDEIKTVTAVLMMGSGVSCMICTYFRFRLRREKQN